MTQAPAVSFRDSRAIALPSRLDFLGLALIAILLLALSPLALSQLGWQYFDTGGRPIEKFHPSTLLSGFLLLSIAARNRNPLNGLIALLLKNRELMPLIAATTIMIVYSSLVLHLPVTVFIETYIGAAMIYMLYRNLPGETYRKLALLIHILMFVNAALGFYEVFTGFRLTPLVINGEELPDETRATALLGHPLANAILAGAYVVMLATGGGRDLPASIRPICFVVAIASLVPFGGRAASGFALLALFFIEGRRFWDVLHGSSIDVRAIIASLVLVPLVGLALVAAFEAGALDTLIDRLVDDEGSASTRLEMFELFKYLSLNDVLFGPDPAVLGTWVRLHGLEYGIESFVVAFILNYGLLATIIFYPPLFLFFLQLARVCRPGAGYAILYFLAAALTSVSLSSKSPTLAIFVLLLLVLLRPDRNDRSSYSHTTG